MAETHFCLRMAETLPLLDGQITWHVSSRCIVRCPIIINNIVKVKAVCKTTFWEESKNMVVDSKGSKSYSKYKNVI